MGSDTCEICYDAAINARAPETHDPCSHDGMFELVGRLVFGVFVGPKESAIYFNTDAGVLMWGVDSDCCSETWFADITGFDARQASNMASIATLLNLGDGILGSLLDLRIVVTTNAAKATLDEAMLRKGRLCRRIHVGPLDRERADAVYDRLAPTRRVAAGDRDWNVRAERPTLGDVYHAALHGDAD